MKGFLLWTFVSFASISAGNANFAEADLIVDAGPLGRVRGVNSSTVGTTSRPFIAFRGIRYAEPPTGTLRFKPSIRYNRRLNATGDEYYAESASPTCIQPIIRLHPLIQSEDCLFLNVYTPRAYNGTGTLLPVIFYIHGGSYILGEGDKWNGNRIMNRDVILVSINYRLGLLGFFSLENEDVPGNAGMYDIVNALRWTKDYIQNFGGDPFRITIAGQSAGSAAVTHLLASPLAVGLFQGAIGVSGSALAEWATTENPLAASITIATMLGCYDPSGGTPNLQVIAGCMRNETHATPVQLVTQLIYYQVGAQYEGRLGFDAVSPTVQRFNTTSPTFEKFLPEHPRTVFHEGRQANVSLMMGATRHDGSYVLGVFYNQFLLPHGYVNNTEFMSQEAVSRILGALGIPDEFGVYDSIAKMYLGETRKTGNFWEMYPGFIDLFSVFFFKASTYQTALYQSKLNVNTYFYSFDYPGRLSVWDTLFIDENDIPPFAGGIAHGDDLIYLFNITLSGQPAFNNEEFAVSNRMMDYWANFVTTGNPTPANSGLTPWSPLTASTPKFMSVARNSTELVYYDDMWSGVGWETLPQEPTTTPPPATTGGSEALLASSNYLILLATATISYFTTFSSYD